VSFFGGLSEEISNRRPVPTNYLADDKNFLKNLKKNKNKKDKYPGLSTWLSCRQDSFGDMADSLVKMLQGLCDAFFKSTVLPHLSFCRCYRAETLLREIWMD